METKKVWFVTGASKGLGLILVKKLLERGYLVAATSRDLHSLVAEVGHPSNSFLPISMDLTDNENVKTAIDQCVNHFGHIDVVVNNAGFGLIGTIEELSDKEVRENFDVNVFGSLNVIRNATPYLRRQRSGHIFNIASIGGYSGGFAGFDIYCSSKFAVAGFTEGLAEALKDFGVHASVVYPGYFRTNFLKSGSIRTAENPIAEYSSARASEQAHLNDIDGNQPNDPERAAEILINVSDLSTPPVHLFLGKDAYAIANQKTELIQQTMAEYEALGTSTNV
ncbi:SDR family oxidoreductase [Sphingobacterium shayense]|uniref:SDR family oxidoreductase n=1 Tax=Sphingobacterium shayense TaxID=626343 RepID=UPI001551B19D|nr:SDR family oxidoreductase [Sphingobacterium shayense]NQD70889.1 SDR family oxidoreductase [Sphingobacterium shayense]